MVPMDRLEQFAASVVLEQLSFPYLPRLGPRDQQDPSGEFYSGNWPTIDASTDKISDKPRKAKADQAPSELSFFNKSLPGWHTRSRTDRKESTRAANEPAR